MQAYADAYIGDINCPKCGSRTLSVLVVCDSRIRCGAEFGRQYVCNGYGCEWQSNMFACEHGYYFSHQCCAHGYGSQHDTD